MHCACDQVEESAIEKENASGQGSSSGLCLQLSPGLKEEVGAVACPRALRCNGEREKT